MPTSKKSKGFIQRNFYIDPRHDKAIDYKAAASHLDRSGVIRAALDLYLANILENAEQIDNLLK